MSLLSKALLTFNARLSVGPESDVYVPARTWAKWLELALADDVKGRPQKDAAAVPAADADAELFAELHGFTPFRK